MKPHSLIAGISGCLVAACGFLLVSGSPLVTVTVPGIADLPLGTLIAWVGAVALPLTIYAAPDRLHPPRTRLDRAMAWLMSSLIGLALAWAPISYWLAGNPAFEFRKNSGFRGGEEALFYFFYLSMAVIVLPLAAMLVYWLLILLLRGRA